MTPDYFLGIYCRTRLLAPQAKQLSLRLNLPLLTTAPEALEVNQWVLVIDVPGIAIQATGKVSIGPIMVDFVHGANAHRRQFGGGKGQMIAKAIGLKGAYRPDIVDVTAGLGQDAFVLATLGCRITLVERSHIIYTLLHDGMERARLSADTTLQRILSQMHLHHISGIDYLQSVEQLIDVIYLDPMFPEKNRHTKANKNMTMLHRIIGQDSDAGELLKAALDKARYRVVVKRPRKAPSLDQQHSDMALPEPSLVFSGKATRFDVYPLKKMP